MLQYSCPSQWDKNGGRIMAYRLYVIVAGVIGYVASFVCFQSYPGLRAFLCMFCACVMGFGIVLVANKFEDLKDEVKGLRKQIAKSEKSDESMGDKE